MGKKTLFKSTSKKKKKSDSGGSKPASKAVASTDAEKKVAAKTAKSQNQTKAVLTKKESAKKSKDKLEATPASKQAQSAPCPKQAGRVTENEPQLASQNESRPIESDEKQIVANQGNPKKVQDDVKADGAGGQVRNVSDNDLNAASLKNTNGHAPARPIPESPAQTKVVIKYGSEVEMETSTETKKGIIISVAALLLIYALIISASVINTRNYYVKTTPAGVEVWQGCFAPLGQKALITIPDVQPPSPVKAVYTRAEIFSFIFEYFLKAADAVIEQPGAPDIQKMDALLHKALQYADSEQNRKAVISRLNGLQQLFLLYKADILMFKGTADDLQTAAEYLERALQLSFNEEQKNRIQAQIETVKRLAADLEASAAGEGDAKEASTTQKTSSQEKTPEKVESTEEKATASPSPDPDEAKQDANKEVEPQKEDSVAKPDIQEEKPSEASE